jgi:hypothetical protein
LHLIFTKKPQPTLRRYLNGLRWFRFRNRQQSNLITLSLGGSTRPLNPRLHDR